MTSSYSYCSNADSPVYQLIIDKHTVCDEIDLLKPALSALVNSDHVQGDYQSGNS
jgi:hypothetical protein